MPVFHVLAAGNGRSSECDVQAEDAATAAVHAVWCWRGDGDGEVTHLLVRRVGDDVLER